MLHPDIENVLDESAMSTTNVQESHASETTIHAEQTPEHKENKGLKEHDPFLVDHFEDGDPADPLNWSHLQRWYLTMAGGILTLSGTFASSAPSGNLPDIMGALHMPSQEIGLLTISLFVLGYCFGPLLWGPLSEEYGRRPVFILTFFFYTVFQAASALSRTTAQLLIFRFIGGTFAAAPLANAGAVVADIWDAKTRGKAFAILTLAPFAGPSLGPIVSGYLAVAKADWRWIFWILTIFAGSCWVLVLFTMPETYKPLLLVKEARRKREATRDERYYAPLERDRPSLSARVERILVRPFKIMFLEPMLMALTIYMSFVYGCLYLLFEAYPIVFQVGHGFNPGVSGLMFLPLLAGGVLAVILYITIFNPRYERRAAQLAPAPVPPEFRLEVALLASPFFAISFFWFAWTSFPDVSFVATMLSGSLMGLSISWIFLSMFNYIIDVYLFAAASALSSSTVVRSMFGAGFPLFAPQMYAGLGPRWASTLLGFVALLLLPIPFVFVKYGPLLRKKSRYAPSKS